MWSSQDLEPEVSKPLVALPLAESQAIDVSTSCREVGVTEFNTVGPELRPSTHYCYWGHQNITQHAKLIVVLTKWVLLSLGGDGDVIERLIPMYHTIQASMKTRGRLWGAQHMRAGSQEGSWGPEHGGVRRTTRK